MRALGMRLLTVAIVSAGALWAAAPAPAPAPGSDAPFPFNPDPNGLDWQITNHEGRVANGFTIRVKDGWNVAAGSAPAAYNCSVQTASGSRFFACSGNVAADATVRGALTLDHPYDAG